MPTYDYSCKACGYKFEECVSITDRDNFAKNTPCPVCKKKKLERGVAVGAFHYDHGVSPFKRAGDGWKEVQDRIKAGAGKNHTIRTK
jgi:putative FmdB family regulatory protein